MEEPIKSKYETWEQISDETVASWVSAENIATKNKRIFEGFEIVDSIDGRVESDTEVSLVKITEKFNYPQHVHNDSDAYFIITDGNATLLSAKNQRMVVKGERIRIPRGTPHGFDLPQGGKIEFVSIQCPPIKNDHTGEEDFHLWEMV